MPPTWSQRPDAAAQARISTGAGHLVVGVFSPLLTGPYFGEVTKGIVEEVEKCGGSTICVQSLNLTVGGYHGSFSEALAREEGAGELTGLAQFGWEHMHCAISIVKAMSPELLLAWQETGKPLVIVSNDVPGARFTAKPDNATGISQAVAHLVQHGRRRIAFAGYMGQGDIVERYEAYRAALAAHGLAFDPALVVEASDNAGTGGEAALAQLLGRGAKVDAVLAATDLNAIAILEGLKAAGFRVPEDIAVVGFDDAAAASACDPPLTTVCPRFEQLGRLAASLVVKAVRGEPTQAGLHLAETDLIVRRSCGCDPVWPQKSRHQSSTVSFRAGLEDFDAGLAMLCGEQDPSRGLEVAGQVRGRDGLPGSVAQRAEPGEPVPVLEAGGTFNLSPAPLGALRGRQRQFPPGDPRPRRRRKARPPTCYRSGPPAMTGGCWLWWPLSSMKAGRSTRSTTSGPLCWQLPWTGRRSWLRSSSSEESWPSPGERERELAEAVQVSEDRYALAAQATNDGLWDWDLGHGQVYYSGRWAEMMGLGSDPITADIGCWLRKSAPARPAGAGSNAHGEQVAAEAALLRAES